jgi:RNA recognition motif-containing protein
MGYGFVTFTSEKSAEEFMSTVTGMMISDKILRVGKARGFRKNIYLYFFFN